MKKRAGDADAPEIADVALVFGLVVLGNRSDCARSHNAKALAKASQSSCHNPRLWWLP